MKSSVKVTLTLSENEYKTLRDLIYVAKSTSYYKDMEDMCSYVNEDEEAQQSATDSIDLIEEFCTLLPEPINLDMYRVALQSNYDSSVQ
jgi:DNA topoisomerase VI subunit A